MSALNSPQPSHRAWLKKADHDILAIDAMIAGKRVPWDNVCFHAQQAAEKILKAFLVYHGQIPQKTHDCVFLLIDCAKITSTLATLQADCRYVTRYGVAPRYPDIAPDPTKKQATAAITAMHRIRTTILGLLPK